MDEPTWQPEPEWHPLPGGLGSSTVGVWRTAMGGRPLVIKRLARPRPGDPESVQDPHRHGYWRREADVLSTGIVAATSGLRSQVAAVDEDAEGITITSEWVEPEPLPGLYLAVALGRFAGCDLPSPRFLARDQLRDRLHLIEHRGGWSTLARTTVADAADHLWNRRLALLDELDALPQVPQHGDPTTANLPARCPEDPDTAVAIDWATLGRGPVGADLGYLSLSSREEFEPLVDAYLLGLPGGLATRDQVELGARAAAVYTALSRADWALRRVAGGEGALAGKFRHPAVAPHLRALQRQSAQVVALLER